MSNLDVGLLIVAALGWGAFFGQAQMFKTVAGIAERAMDLCDELSAEREPSA